MLLAAVGAPLAWTTSGLGCVHFAPLRPRLHLTACAEAGPDPEEWRAFRAKLISGGLRLTGDEDGGGGIKEPEAAPPKSSASVAPKNEELLKEQNEELWKEYYGGAWAHASPGPEAGGLVARVPLQAQLTTLMRGEPGDLWGDIMRETFTNELPKVDAADAADDESAARLQEQWSSNTVYTYRLADRLISDTLKTVSEMATDGRISIDKVTAEQRAMLEMYSAAQDEWQEVCLVLEGDAVGCVANSALVINRPIAKAMSRQLAELILNGGEDDPNPRYGPAFVDRFMEAFGDEAAVYVGGPEEQNRPGMLIHGTELDGAEELAPGTRIFTGGFEAAVAAVKAGTCRPLDFRFFIGRRKDVETRQGAWVPVACARPVALKQCLGLPKPLWHEVLELCGGEMAALSAIELLKRPDLE